MCFVRKTLARRTAVEAKLIVKLKNSTLTNMEIRCMHTKYTDKI